MAVDVKDGGLLNITVIHQPGHRFEALRTSGMTGNKNKIFVVGAFRIPFQIVFAPDWLAAFVDAEESHVEVASRIGEIIGIAAEECGLLFRREDQADVRIALITIEPVFAAAVQGDHVGAEAGGRLAFALDRRYGGAACGKFLFGSFRVFKRFLHAGRHVLHRYESIDFQVGRLHFGVGRGGVESDLDVVVFGCGILLQLSASDVMVGQKQAVRADERPRTAVVQAHTGKPDVIEPGFGWREVVICLSEASAVNCQKSTCLRRQE